jgi:ABC-2 type transport system ATP-binding protein
MSVAVEGLTKYYGNQRAIDNLTFRVGKGEILGLLGPNGAGKTTTLKILAGYSFQSAGIANVNGFDTQQNPVELKGSVGYLPENNPLYDDMYVIEYLLFVCGLYKLTDRRTRVEKVIKQTGLLPEKSKKLSALSKGYRQRVGLAQALIHDPPVLILDEPTSGLDPNQLIEIRKLIQSLGKEKTVILSTHILQEVQAICDRVIIINQGKLIVDEPIQKLRHYLDRSQMIHCEFSRPVYIQTLLSEPGIINIAEVSNCKYVITASPGKDIRPVLFDYAVKKNLQILEMYTEKVSVEDVFKELTRSSLE